MGNSFNTNLFALSAQRSLTKANAELGRVFERLSSGVRINRASDDAAGLAISSNLHVNSRIYGQAVRNGNDAVSALSVSEGALDNLTSLLIRMRELATQASNGTLSTKQRQALHTEAQALKDEFQRIQSTTRFNGQLLVSDGESQVGIQLGIGSQAVLNIGLGISGTTSTTTAGASYGSHDASTAASESTDGTAVGDFTNDGLSDLVTISATDGRVNVYLSDGSAIDSSGAYFTDAISPLATAVQTGDFNNDGLADFAVTFTDGTVAAYTNNGAGFDRFDVNISSGIINTGVAPVITDVNGDGFDDIVVASGGDLYSLVSDGSGSFSETSSGSTVGGTITSFTIGEYDGSFGPDVMLKHSGSGSIYYLKNDGTGNFNGPTATTASGAHVLSVGDISGDGNADLVTSNGGGFTVYQGTGSGGFTGGTFYAVAGGFNLASGDYNGDGNLDILIDDGNSTVYFYKGDPSGNFNLDFGLQAPVAGLTSMINTGDINGDGYADVIGSNQGGSDVYQWISVEDSGGGTTTTTTTTLKSFSLLSANAAKNAMTTIDNASTLINRTKGDVGAALGRISVALGALQSLRDGSEEAASRIRDTDVAEDSSSYLHLQIKQNTASAILAQANVLPELLLRLLQSE